MGVLNDPDSSREREEIKAEAFESAAGPIVSFMMLLSVSVSPHAGGFDTGGSSLGGSFEPGISIWVSPGVL